ncbi:hypothetical protein NL349_27330, partial [Klebsiella pneumoniae]|nr:hypothetical protein [Klebsiella pneumoniae]
TPQIPTPVPAGQPPATTLTNAGSGGRYEITPRPFAPFVIVPAAGTAPAPAAQAPAAPAPAPAAPKAKGPSKVKIATTSLSARGGKVSVRL